MVMVKISQIPASAECKMSRKTLFGIELGSNLNSSLVHLLTAQIVSLLFIKLIGLLHVSRTREIYFI